MAARLFADPIRFCLPAWIASVRGWYVGYRRERASLRERASRRELGSLQKAGAAPRAPASYRELASLPKAGTVSRLEPLRLRLSGRPLGRVSERFLSVNLDPAQLVGGRFWGGEGRVERRAGGSAPVPPFDFTRERLVRLTRELAPAYLRIGGTASDEIFFDPDGADPPPPFRYTLSGRRWEEANRFALQCGLELVFTFNGGVGTRDRAGRWRAEQARTLLDYGRAQGYTLSACALGNEPNFFPVTQALWLPPEQWTEDYSALRSLLGELAPGTRLLGPACAFWPVVGELLPVFPRLLRQSGMLLDAVSWHYYPQQSRRSPVAVRRASPVRALRASFLGESLRWSRWVRGFRDRYAPGAELWLEEAGNAQCGGEPGLSDRFAAGFWWLDLLGQMAGGGHQVVMRHNLSGADYGLLSAESLEPNPDYWNSLLWRRLMGTEVLEAGSTPTRPDLRLYAHRTRGKENSVTVLALNISRRETLCLDTGGGAAEIYLLSAPRLLGRELFLNGRRLAAGKDGSLPALEPRLDRRGIVELPPASYAFVVLDRSFG